MADNSRDSPSNTNNNNNKDTTTILPIPSSKSGLILGKDGKPCRTCNSFSAFNSVASKSLKGTTTTATTTTNTKTAQKPPPDCPPDVEELGRATWTLLHTITATYASTPTPPEQTQMRTFLDLFSRIYPCWSCAADFQSYMEREKVRVESREAFGRWMCEAHNEVNRKLGKREFDCEKWEERWGEKAWKKEAGGRCGGGG